MISIYARPRYTALILWSCFSLRINRGKAYRRFFWMCEISLACTLLDVGMEFTVNPLPLSSAAVTAGFWISTLYLVLRNATLVIYLLLLFAITRTEHRLQPLRRRLLIWLPYGILFLLLVQNFWTRNVFSVTAEEGYRRQPLMYALYGIAALYGLAGAGYCLHYRKYLPPAKWFSLLSVYLLTFIAVAVQLFFPNLLVEMFSTSVGLLMILLHVTRPDENIDPSLGVRSSMAYQADLSNLLKSGQPIDILIAQLTNAAEVRAYLGDRPYDELIRTGLETFRQRAPEHGPLRQDIYFERPDTIYVILENAADQAPLIAGQLSRAMKDCAGQTARAGVRLSMKICLIRAPQDLSDLQDILHLGHRFPLLSCEGQLLLHASELVGQRNFALVNHVEDILHRAVSEETLEIFYQPIYDLRHRSFRSAEALVRLRDPEFGLISPDLFIPAAERSGLIVPLGARILEAVFRFLSHLDFSALGLETIHVNLSVAQCMDPGLYDTVTGLQRRYGVRPETVILEITETTFDRISDAARESLSRLSEAGYRFALDDYGVGYSNIQRLSRLNFDLVKLDKSLVDGLHPREDGLTCGAPSGRMHDLASRLCWSGGGNGVRPPRPPGYFL